MPMQLSWSIYAYWLSFTLDYLTLFICLLYVEVLNVFFLILIQQHNKVQQIGNLVQSFGIWKKKH